MTDDWRNDPGLVSQIEYRKRFALLPVRCSDGEQVWFKHYYSKYKEWGDESPFEYSLHTDFIENITEAEYIIRKLSENL